MVGCCVPRCGKNSSNPADDKRFTHKHRITYHQFPAIAAVRAEWVRILHEGGRPLEWEPSNNTKICSLHFDLADLKTTEKGTQIRKGASPIIPKTDYVKPLRRSKAKTKEAFERLVQDAVEAEPISVDFYLNSPSTSAAEMYNIVDEILDEQEELASPIVKRKKVAMLPNMAEETSHCKKVVKMADNHTFDAAVGATYEDPCLNTYSELMDLLKKFNQQMSLHHPSKASAVHDLVMKASNIFTPEETEQPEKMVYTTLTSDPLMSGVDSSLANEMWVQDAMTALNNIPEQEFADYLDHPEKFLV